MKLEDVIVRAVRALESGTLKPTFHALQRMKERNILLSDLHEAIYNATREEHKDELNSQTGDWKYAIRGMNDDGNKDIRIVLVFKNPSTLILTVIDLN